MVKLWEKESQEHSKESQKRSQELSLNTQLDAALKVLYALDGFVQVRLQALFLVVGSIMHVTEVDLLNST